MATRTKTVEQPQNEINLLNESEENIMSETSTNQDEYKKIKRSAYASYLNTGTKTTPVFERMGQGISEMNLEYNPEEEEEKYIHQDSATHMITGYAPASDVDQKCHKNEPIFEYIDAKRRARAIESEAETQILDVFIYDKKAEGVYGAELNDAIVVINSFSGDTIGYAVKRNGDPIQGYATITTTETGGKKVTTVTFKEGEYLAS